MSLPQPFEHGQPASTDDSADTRLPWQLGIGGSYWSQVLFTSAPLLLADALAAGGSVAIASAATGSAWPAGVTAVPGWLLVVAGLLVINMALHLYPATGLNPVSELRQITITTSVLFSVLLASAWGNGATITTIQALAGGWLLSLGAVPYFRGLARSLASRCSWWGQPALIFGHGEAPRQLFRHYQLHPALGLRPVAIVDDQAQCSETMGTVPIVTPEQGRQLQKQQHISWAIVTEPLSASSVRCCSACFSRVIVVRNQLQEMPCLRNRIATSGGLSATVLTNRLLLPLHRCIKCVMDYVLVVVGGLVCLPLVAMIAMAIRLTSPGPVFYAQQRIGKHNRTIWAWKFRTMVMDADDVLEQYLASDAALREEWERDHKLKHDPRVTWIGGLLRKTSLDELPQIWNVVRGDMSLVGPRPIVTAEIPKYGDSFALYASVTPGITGLWQISGRNNTTYEERVSFDSYYALNWSPWLDVYILVRTILVVLRREGAY